MGTTADKLNKILQSKLAIKAAIEAKGVADVGDILANYPDKIASIQSGGGSETKYTGHADVEGLKAIGWTDEDIQYYQENGVNWNEEDDDLHKVPQDNIDLYGVLNENNIQDYMDLIVYLPKIEITKTDLSSMFGGCNKMVAIPLLNTSIVTNFSYMFTGCYLLTTIPQLDTSSATNMHNMFSGCYSLVTIPQLDTLNVDNFNGIFNNCYSLETIPQLDTSSATNMSNMFNNCYSLETIPQLDTSSVTDMPNMFINCRLLTTIPQLDTSSATNMIYMFSGCYSLETIPQLDTFSATNMSNMFSGCYILQYINIDNLNVSISLSKSTFLSKESLLYMIQNAAPTSAITITLHSNVYDKYIEDPDIVSALSAQPNITLAK